MKRTAASLLMALLCMIGFAVPVGAATEEPISIVRRLNDVLLQVMKNAADLGFDGRYEVLAPVLDNTFAFAEMARISAGQHWERLGPDRQAELAARFRQMSITTFAARFDGYSGEQLTVLGQENAPRGRMLVRSQILKTSGEKVPLNYVFTEVGEAWRAVDIYLQGTISELAVYRSEFVSVLNREGYDGLIRRIDDKIARLRS